MLSLVINIVVVLILFVPQLCLGGQVTDQVGREVTVPDSPKRLVALAPNVAEIVFLLGRGEVLKGATQYSNHPEAAKLLPRVGSYVRLDVEKIVALKPDLCLAVRDGNPIHSVERIESLGIPVYVVDPHSLADIMDVVLRIGGILGVRERALEIVVNMERRIKLIRDKLTSDVPRPGVFFQIDAAPIISAGSNTFIHELIVTAGGRNLAAGVKQYPRFGWEDIIIMQPDIAIIASMAGGHSVANLKESWRKWPQLRVVKNNRLHVVDADLIDRPTPRLIDGLEEFAVIIHPELFGERSGK